MRITTIVLAIFVAIAIGALPVAAQETPTESSQVATQMGSSDLQMFNRDLVKNIEKVERFKVIASNPSSASFTTFIRMPDR